MGLKKKLEEMNKIKIQQVKAASIKNQYSSKAQQGLNNEMQHYTGNFFNAFFYFV
jgi:phage-related protein